LIRVTVDERSEIDCSLNTSTLTKDGLNINLLAR